MISWFKHLLSFIKILCKYAVFLWKHHCIWDYSILLQLLKFQLKQMEPAFRSNSAVSVGSEERANEMRNAIELIEAILEDNFADDEYKAFYKKWGLENSGLLRFKMNHKDQEQMYYELRRVTILEEHRKRGAYNRLFTLLSSKIRNWWD